MDAIIRRKCGGLFVTTTTTTIASGFFGQSA
jgi:hypothetical protein